MRMQTSALLRVVIEDSDAKNGREVGLEGVSAVCHRSALKLHSAKAYLMREQNSCISFR
jgi:hypothetical protein